MYTRSAGPRRQELTTRFTRAVAYAARLHAQQKRKGTERHYIAHLLGVASIVLDHGGDEDTAIAALLHDAVEDQGGRPRLAEIRRKFGVRVARIVDGCTDAYTDPKPPWRPRKERYIAHLVEAPAEVRLVSAADKLHNAREVLSDYRRIGDAIWSRFQGGKEGTLWYYRALLEALRQAGTSPLVEEFERVVTELERLAASER
ncbi:MAG: HD domain-containing protein [Candidatus Acidiferrales bacterium]